jgi:hypothetical protein
MTENFTDYVREDRGSMDDNSAVEKRRLERRLAEILAILDEIIARHEALGLAPETDELLEARQIVARIEARQGAKASD